MMDEGRREIQRILTHMDEDRQKVLGEIIHFVKKRCTRENNEGQTPPDQWILLISGAGNVFEKELNGYILKPTNSKGNNLLRIGNEYKWIITHLTHYVMRRVWPKTVLPVILSVLSRVQDEGVCYTLSFNMAECLRKILRVRYYKHHLGSKAWKEVMDMCLKILNRKNIGLSLRLSLCNTLLMILASNKNICDLRLPVMSFCIRYINQHKQETHGNFVIVKIMVYMLTEPSPEIFYENAICELLTDSFTIFVSLFAASRINSDLSNSLIDLFQLIIGSGRVINKNNCNILLQLSDVILDKIPINPLVEFSDLINIFINEEFGWINALYYPKNKKESSHAQNDEVPSRNEYVKLLKLHCHVISTVIKHEEKHLINDELCVESESPEIESVVSSFFATIFSGERHNHNRQIWSIQVICLLVTSCSKFFLSLNNISFDKFNFIFESSLVNNPLVNLKAHWLMVLMSLMLRAKCHCKNDDTYLPLNFIIKIKELSEVAFNGFISPDEGHRDVCSFVIENVMSVIKYYNLTSSMSWFLQQFLSIMTRPGFDLTSIIVIRSCIFFLSMIKENQFFKANLTVVLKLLIRGIIGNVINSDKNFIESYPLSDIDNIASKLLIRICDDSTEHSYLSSPFDISQLFFSPFNMFSNETILVESKILHLTYMHSVLANNDIPTIFEQFFFDELPDSNDSKLKLTTTCDHKYSNIEIICFIANIFYEYVSTNFKVNNPHSQTDDPLSGANNIHLTYLYLSWISSFRLCKPSCHLTAFDFQIIMPAKFLIMKLVNNLSSNNFSDILFDKKVSILMYGILNNIDKLIKNWSNSLPKNNYITNSSPIVNNDAIGEWLASSNFINLLLDIFMKNLFVGIDVINVNSKRVDMQVEIDEFDNFNVDTEIVKEETLDISHYHAYPIHLETLYGNISAHDFTNQRTLSEYCCFLHVYSLATLSRMLFRIGTKNIKHPINVEKEFRKMIDAFIHILPKIYNISVRCAFSTLRWMKIMSYYFNENDISTIIKLCFQMLSEYKLEIDPTAWIYLIRCLTYIVPPLSCVNQSPQNIKNVSHIFVFFNSHIYNGNTHWRVLLEIENFLIACLESKIGNNTSLFDCISHLQENKDWLKKIALYFIKHENSLVRATSYKICIMCMDSRITKDASLRDIMYSRISYMPAVNDTFFLTSALSLGSCVIKLEEYRLRSISCLLHNSYINNDLIYNILCRCAKSLNYPSCQEMLKIELLNILCFSKYEDTVKFPYKFIGQSTLLETIQNFGSYFVYDSLNKYILNDKAFIFPRELQSDINALKNTIPWALGRYILDLVNYDLSRNDDEGEGLSKKLSKFLKCDQGYDDISARSADTISKTIMIILGWCFDNGENSEEGAYFVKKRKNSFIEKAFYMAEDARKIMEAIESKSCMNCESFSNNYFMSINNEKIYVYTFRSAAMAIFSVAGIYKNLNNKTQLSSIDELFSEINIEMTFNKEISYRILLLIGKRLRNDKLISRKKLFIRFGYTLFITIFKEYLRDNFLFQLMISHINAMLLDSNFHSEACTLLLQICSHYAENDVSVLESNFLNIITNLSHVASNALYSHNEKKISKDTANLIESILCVSKNINEDVIKQARMHLSSGGHDFYEGRSRCHLYTPEKLLCSEDSILTNNLHYLRPSIYDTERHRASSSLCENNILNVRYSQCILREIIDFYNGRKIKSHLTYNFGLNMNHQNPGSGNKCVSFNSEEPHSMNFHTHVTLIVANMIISTTDSEDYCKFFVCILKKLIDHEDGRVVFSNFPTQVLKLIETIRSFKNLDLSIVSSDRVYPHFTNSEIWNFSENSDNINTAITTGINHHNGEEQDRCRGKYRFEQWTVLLINSLITSLLSDEFHRSLPVLFEAEPSLAETFLPHIIHMCLICSENSKSPGLDRNTTKTFSTRDVIYYNTTTLRKFLSTNFSKLIANPEHTDRNVIRTLINVTEFLIHKTPPTKITPFESYKWLDLNYYDLASAAYVLNLYVSALRFAELSFEEYCHTNSNQLLLIDFINNNNSNETSSSSKSSKSTSVKKLEFIIEIWERLGEKCLDVVAQCVDGKGVQSRAKTCSTGNYSDNLLNTHNTTSTFSKSFSQNSSLFSPENSGHNTHIEFPLPLNNYDFDSSSWENILKDCQLRLHAQKFSNAVLGSDNQEEDKIELNLMESFCKVGNYHVLNRLTDSFILRNFQKKDDHLSFSPTSKLEQSLKFLNIRYEGLWRNGNFEGEEYCDQNLSCGRVLLFNELIYKSLTAITSGKMKTFRYFNEINFFNELSNLSKTGIRLDFESIKKLLILMELTEISEITNTSLSSESSDCSSISNSCGKIEINENGLCKLLKVWESRIRFLAKRHSFSDLEYIVDARGSLMKALLDAAKNSERLYTTEKYKAIRHIYTEALYTIWFNYSQLALDNGDYKNPLNKITKLKAIVTKSYSSKSENNLKITNLDQKMLDVSLQSMKVMWGTKTMVPTKQRFHEIRNHALTILNRFPASETCGFNKIESEKLCSSAARLIGSLGAWAGEARSENPDNISYEYFDTAISITLQENKTKKHELLYEIYEKYARFAHEQYDLLTSKDSTNEMKDYIDYKLSELEASKNLHKSDKQSHNNSLKKPKIENMYQNVIKKMKLQIDMGNQEIETYRKKLLKFFKLAIKNYLLALQVGDKDLDLCAFRLCNLWFSNIEDMEICEMIDEYNNHIPSYKFVPLFYQFAARCACMVSENVASNVLQRILYKASTDHPHHTIYHLIALDNSYYESGTLCTIHREPKLFPKRSSLNKILTIMKSNKNKKCKEITMGMELLANKMIDLMKYEISSLLLKKTKFFFVDDISDIRKIQDSPISIPIHNHPISKTSSYENIPTLKYFKPKFFVPGGINKPKVIQCVGSDGAEYSILVKGKDDLKQDSVLMSIFDIVNRFFYNDSVIREKLKIRVYNVVPLAQRAGMVEWVNNTMPIGSYLTEAHAIYNPEDYTPEKAYSKMYSEYKKQDSTCEMKLNTFEDVLKHFNPVFRYFFLENYKSAREWFSCKSAYSRSLACMSIAGYIVGLGDRHAYNILVDKTSGELIHVDFGVAFEQGKLLSVPETVPFRLTRDLVDGLGRMGCEGIYRRSCEDTLRILIKSAEIFLLILNALKYDPLYNWRLSPLDQYKRQNFMETPFNGIKDVSMLEPFEKAKQEITNKEAERALLNIRLKLSSPLSVKCQINELIEAATDKKNLCAMYPGWQAWM